MYLQRIAIVVSDYDPAINFFVTMLGFDLIEDIASTANDGNPKRWVVVQPPGGQTSIVLARADGPEQERVVGRQLAGRVGFFLQVEDFQSTYSRLTKAGVEFVTAPRTEPYGQVAIFVDIAGNRWDLIGP